MKLSMPKIVLVIVIIFGIFVFQFALNHPVPNAQANVPGCVKCHGDVEAVHHNLVETSGYDCLDCHQIYFDSSIGTYVFAPVDNCFYCHDGAKHAGK